MDAQRKIRLGARFKEAGSTGNKTHVIASKGHWVLFKEGANRNLAEYPTKGSAVQKARKILNSGQTEMIVIHNTDGSVAKVQLAN